MFLALRRLLFRDRGTEEQGARELSLSGLFIFEFVVVLLGVLAAQTIQNVAQTANERRIARTAVKDFERDKADFVDFIAYVEHATPCVEAYLDALHDRADFNANEDTIATPKVLIPQPWVTAWDAQTIRAVVDRYDRDIYQDHTNLERYSQRLFEADREASALWGTVSVLQRPGSMEQPLLRAEVHSALGQLAANWQQVERAARGAAAVTSGMEVPVTTDRVNGALSGIPGCETRI